MLSTLKKIFGIGPSVDLSELIRNGASIVDVRTKGEYAQGHVKNSVNIPLDQLKANMDKIKKMKQPVITCCASGMRSASAKAILQSNGVVAHNGGSWLSVNNKL